MSAKPNCQTCKGKGIHETGSNDLKCHCVSSQLFDDMHYLYHEVAGTHFTTFAKLAGDALANSLGAYHKHKYHGDNCPACAAGYARPIE